MGTFDFECDENSVELYVDEVVEHMIWACKETVSKLRQADERSKRDYDANK